MSCGACINDNAQDLQGPRVICIVNPGTMKTGPEKSNVLLPGVSEGSGGTIPFAFCSWLTLPTSAAMFQPSRSALIKYKTPVAGHQAFKSCQISILIRTFYGLLLSELLPVLILSANHCGLRFLKNRRRYRCGAVLLPIITG
ncbi:hypothetical protein CG432_16035 [Pantoea ananatis]|nr:hypothetical protein CG432_16035 [Pantoea ananatis]